MLFAIVTTAYVLVALPLEERDLVAALGISTAITSARYRSVPMLLPVPHRGSGKTVGQH
ncbi:hypothetical protein I551_4086 [Mycobacterium ulcerans str. Harvey]|uniref:Uncharacterized protein n=1 Tax=Mycobacterium ulcerans str. Harvey TaxID=1299332 RepID=A0ABN0QXG6_MYCUL|nr:hypothetical protein I551_4086 [Mycobacterium ulcerans str. Harvey]